MKKLYVLIITAIILHPGTFAQSPIISVDPDSLAENLLSGKSTTRVLTIYNSGGSDLNFEINIENIQSDLISTDVKIYDDSFISDLNNLSESTSLNISIYNQYSDNYTPLRGPIKPEDIGPYNLEKTLTGGLNILIITSIDYPAEIRNLLLSFPDIETVDVFNARNNSPDLNQLLTYHSVILMNNWQYGNPEALGNVLADYVDVGGGLIMTIATFVEGWEVQGRLLNEDYFPFNLSSGLAGSATLGNFNQNHPIMQGVTSAFGRYLRVVTVADGAELIAEWNNGQPFVATKGYSVVAVNIFVSISGLWTGDIPLILHNAAFWTAGCLWLTAEPSSGTIPAGSFLEVTMTFDAAGLSGGGYDANIIISSNDPLLPEVTVPAHLNVTDAPSISVSTDSLNFGEVYLGVNDSLELEVINNGSQELLIFSAITQPSEYGVYPTFAGIDPGENEAFTVYFSPQQAGNCPGTLTFNSNDPLFGNYVITLNGLGVEPPVILVNPDSIYIEVLPGHTRSKQLTISNIGESNLSFDVYAAGNSTNYALQFDGIDDYCLIPNSPSLDIGTNKVTVEAWVKLSFLPSQISERFAGIYGSVEDSYVLYEDRNRAELRFKITDSDGTAVRPGIPQADLNTGIWYHIAGVYDGNNGTAKIYLNGILKDTHTNNVLTGNVKPGQIASFGSEVGIRNFFKGIIDEARVWNVARTQAEIQQFMRQELTGKEPGLVSYWQFNEATGDTVYDKSEFGNHGALHNGVEWVQSSAPIAPPWLSVFPDSGVCYPNASVDISLIFDATEIDTGDYYAAVFIKSNDPIQPIVSVPVHMLVSTIAGVDKEYLIPTVFNLYQNYPNPFNPTTTFRYDIPENTRVVLKVYNILGEEVVTLINEEKVPGSYEIIWDAVNVSSGIYFYNIKAGDFVETKKMVLLR